MKKFSLFFSFLVFLAAGLPTAALADGDGEFTATGTYAAGTMVTPLTAPGQTFTISFDLPTNPTSLMEDYDTGDDFYLNAIPAIRITAQRSPLITHCCPSILPTRLRKPGDFSWTTAPPTQLA